MRGDTWLALIWVIVCAALIIALAYLFTRYVAGRGGFGGFTSNQNQQFKVVARLSLGRDQGVALIQAGKRFFLLGVTPSSISTLAELTQEEAETWTSAQAAPANPQTMGFREALQKVIQQRRQR